MIYILNPGDGHDVETYPDYPPTSKDAARGQLYRADSYGHLEFYDKSTGAWYEVDQGNVQIKVLRAAGLHP